MLILKIILGVECNISSNIPLNTYIWHAEAQLIFVTNTSLVYLRHENAAVVCINVTYRLCSEILTVDFKEMIVSIRKLIWNWLFRLNVVLKLKPVMYRWWKLIGS